MTKHDHAIALARRYYHHKLHGGSLTAKNIAFMVEVMERMQAEIIKLSEDQA